MQVGSSGRGSWGGAVATAARDAADMTAARSRSSRCGIPPVVLAAALAASVCPAQPEGGFDLWTSTVRQHAAGRWTTLDVQASNPTDEDVEKIISVTFGGSGGRQFARRLWVPAHSERTTWLPVEVPPRGDGQSTRLTYTTIIIDAADGAEVLSRRDGDMLTTENYLRLADDPVPSGVYVDQLWMLDAEAAEVEGDEWKRVLASARAGLGLPEGQQDFYGSFLPPWRTTLRGLDVLVLASDRIVDDTAGLAALRAWVRDGGRLWIGLDAVQPATLTAILGDAARIDVVDRVPLDLFTIEAIDRAGEQTTKDLVDLEQPVDFVRVVTDHPDVSCRIDGWPAAIWVPFGDGEILLTTLGPRGWMSPQDATASAGLLVTGKRLLQGRPVPLEPLRLTPMLEQQIGYRIPPRSLAAVILGGHCAALALAGGAWLARGRLGRLGWFVPAASATAAAVLAGVGAAGSTRVPATVAQAEIVRLGAQTDEALVDGTAAVYDRQSRDVAWEADQRQWLLPLNRGGATADRLVFLDDDVATTRATSTHAGSVDLLAITGDRPLAGQVGVRARFGPNGLEGRIHDGGLGGIEDPVIVAPPRPALGVALADDGTFGAGVDDTLAADQYSRDTILTEVSRRRQDAVRRLLMNADEFTAATGQESASAGWSTTLPLRDRPWLVFWCRPPEDRWRYPDGFALEREALAIMPLDLDRTPADTPFRIPGTFLPARVGTGRMGRSSAYDARSGSWVKGLTSATATMLRFQVPASVLPCRLERGRLTVRLVAPRRTFSVSAFRGGEPVVLAEVAEPTGVYDVELSAEDLGLVDGDEIPIEIAVSPTAAEIEAAARAADGTPPAAIAQGQAAWHIDSVALSIDGRTLPHPAASEGRP